MSSSRASSVRFDAVLQNAREPVFLLGADRRLLLVNKAWEELTGHALESVQGLVCRPSGPSRAGEAASLAGGLSPPPEALAGRTTSGRTLLVRADGERIWRRVEFLPLRDEDDRVSHVLGVVREPEAEGDPPESQADRWRYELMEIRHRLHARYGFDALVGRGPAHHRLLDRVRAVAATTAPATIVGEKGTGKRQVARIIHQNGPLGRRPLRLFDCAVLPPEALERGLFQVEHEAEGRSLLLLNVEELHRDLQARLAMTLGDDRRVLATTAVAPRDSLDAERLRPDLYFALSTFEIPLVPLRDRVDEIPLFALHFLERSNARGGRTRDGFAPEALRVLQAHDWPGNLQELARVVDASHEVGPGDRIRAEDLPGEIKGARAAAFLPALPRSETLDQLMERVERRLIEQALARAGRNKSRAAELLGISRPRLYRRIKELSIPVDLESDAAV